MLLPLPPAKALILALAVAGSPGAVRASPGTAPPRGEISLQVQNDNFNDATVYAVRPGLRQRVGWVSGLGKDSFSFRWPMGELRVEIDLFAAGRYYTEVVEVGEGDELQLTIQPYLDMLPSGAVF